MKGEILVFVDSDMTFDKNFLKMLTKPIVAGKSKGTFQKMRLLVTGIISGLDVGIKMRAGWIKRAPKELSRHTKVFRAILRTEFDKVGGFTAGGYNDD